MGIGNSNRHAKRKAQTTPAPGVVQLAKLSRLEPRGPTTRLDRSAERRSRSLASPTLKGIVSLTLTLTLTLTLPPEKEPGQSRAWFVPQIERPRDHL